MIVRIALDSVRPSGRKHEEHHLRPAGEVLAERTGWECRIVTMTFRVDDENDALEVAEDLALLEGSKLITNSGYSQRNSSISVSCVYGQ